MGAEQLLGRGDMLFLLPGSASPIRLHNALIELDEIEKIMNHIESQPKPDEVMLPETKEKKVVENAIYLTILQWFNYLIPLLILPYLVYFLLFYLFLLTKEIYQELLYENYSLNL